MWCTEPEAEARGKYGTEGGAGADHVSGCGSGVGGAGDGSGLGCMAILAEVAEPLHILASCQYFLRGNPCRNSNEVSSIITSVHQVIEDGMVFSEIREARSTPH